MRKSHEGVETQFGLGVSPSALAVGERAGYQLRGLVPVYNRVLRAGYWLRTSGLGPFERGLRLAREAGGRLVRRPRRPQAVLMLERVSSFGPEVCEVMAKAEKHAILTERDPARLNAFLRFPRQNFSGWHLRDETGRIRGFALLNLVPHDEGRTRTGKIVDCLLDEIDVPLWHAAIQALAQELARGGGRGSVLRFHAVDVRGALGMRIRLTIWCEISHSRSSRLDSAQRDVSPNNARRRLRIHVKLRGIPNKREFLVRMLERFGALKLLERAVTRCPAALVVLAYHRIAERGTDLFYDPVISAAPQTFRAQLDWLSKRMRILTLSELDERVRTGGPVNEPAAFVTFDDGYRDNFVEAVPILKEFDVPATFFIPTEFLESPNLPWWDHVAYVIKQTARRQLRLKGSPSDDDSPLEVELDGNSRDAAISAIIRAILEGRVADLPWFLEHLAAQAEVQVNSQILGRDLFMGWEEVRQLIEHGGRLTIGSHAHSHPNLSKLDLDLQQRELGLSKQILEERLGREIAAIAYPFGWPGTYNDATKKAAREAGYRLAFASRTGVNHLGGAGSL